MKIWKLLRTGFEHPRSFTWETIYLDPLVANNEMFEQYDRRFHLYKEDVIVAEYHPGTCANLVLKDGRRWTWTIDKLEVA